MLINKNTSSRLFFSLRFRSICSFYAILLLFSLSGCLLSSCMNIGQTSLAITEYRGSVTTESTKYWNEELGIYVSIQTAADADTTSSKISKIKQAEPTGTTSIVNETTKYEDEDGTLEVHFIDVGTADCALIKQGEFAMLIDSGGSETSDYVVSYIKEQGITKLDYVIGTHLHEDHIGGMDDVMGTFDIGQVILADTVSTTDATYQMLYAIENEGCQLFPPKIGDIYDLGDADFQFFAPGIYQYDDINNRSIVTKITYGSTSFLMMGDAEGESEEDIILLEKDIKADVIKIGHHGSYSSSTEGFLGLVSPTSAVISVGSDNSYGHPSERVLNNLIKLNVDVYRTDLAGTIVACSNGIDIEFNCTPDAGEPGT